jgi:hypothetical protein
LTLALATLACQTLTRAFELEGPEDLATDVVGEQPTRTPRPTSTPKITPTLGPTPTAHPTLESTLVQSNQFDLRPEFTADMDLFPDATRYTIDVTAQFNADGTATLTGRELIRFTNTHTDPLNEMALMLWPNDSNQYLSDFTLLNVLVDGQAVDFDLQDRGLSAHFALPDALALGESVDISTEFSVAVFPGLGEAGPARFGITHGVLLAPTFYPLIPRWAEGEWQTQPAPTGGDTTTSDTAFYTWRITAPADLAVIGTGRIVEQSSDAQTQTQTLTTGPVRDLALVVGPLTLTQREVDGITLNAYMLAEHADLEDEMLDYVETQVTTLQDRVGPYPFTELDVVDAPGAFGGIEYPGVIFIGVVEDGSDFFVRATVHEVGHQWFYSLIGDDQLREPWLDEAAASYTEILYIEATDSPKASRNALVEFRAYVQFASDPELPIGLPVEGYGSGSDYGIIVYAKGALFFNALRQELGDEIFFNFLRAFFDEYRYGLATSADFHQVAEETCACDLDELFDLWVYVGGNFQQ